LSQFPNSAAFITDMNVMPHSNFGRIFFWRTTGSNIGEAQAQRQAKRKIPELTAAVEGHRMSDHHRWMIRPA
jgi:hypothetical protein